MTSNALLNAAVLATLRGISFVSISQFNTTIDGATDNTSAWQNAAALGKNIYAPAGTHRISAWINLLSNVTVFGEDAQTILKPVSSTSYSSGQMIFNIAGKDNVTVRNLTFDGNKGNIGTARLNVNTVFQSTRVSFLFNKFQNCEGVGIIASTDCHDFTAAYNEFTNCGGNRDNSDGFRKQGIAFSNSAGHSSLRPRILFNKFNGQGLDSISLSRCIGGLVIGNEGESSYTLIYNGSGSPSYDMAVANNVARNVSSAGGPNNPNAIDLPGLIGGSVTGNVVDTCDAVGIGVFVGSSNLTVTGNTVINPCQNVASWNGGISIGGSGTASSVSNVKINDNTIIDTNGTALMPYGIVMADDLVNVEIGNNNIVNPLISKYGKFVATSGVTGHVSALTSNTGISASTFIHDVDAAGAVETAWRAFNTKVGFQVNGTQVVSAQVTGYGTPTGNSRTASFNGASATLAQTSAQLAQLIVDLKTHGLLGV